ncbi:hypothetical protein SCLARK_001102 [Spiroplasma clarkii]|uniref:hypothetical protein n=1 Tax=Spiroplasma clarkii TaxID=2139 RepID=UPI000B57102E|nr:hypothetical protein [Spiroplasma clarkii]ARU91671.1 hypothetical protein SCLARK_001102 [Spiroplasma clarkii]
MNIKELEVDIRGEIAINKIKSFVLKKIDLISDDSEAAFFKHYAKNRNLYSTPSSLN